jgi:hypothetical protein
MALDIADTVGATNSVERMLAHQLDASINLAESAAP